ncbi:hypothetical protein [Phascolarctobacterium succinatutens]|uniref:hypothetical protein n=1 Tax=Phascolarctobacterium succinatutens TaxID=626940 RepID=UPI0026ED1D77|nr:hypothetical protein [Phascolarctobacterium succinatutens]
MNVFLGRITGLGSSFASASGSAAGAVGSTTGCGASASTGCDFLEKKNILYHLVISSAYED